MMNKIKTSILLLFILWLILHINDVFDGKMVKEITKLEKPTGFDMTDVNSIVESYIPMGTSRQKAREILNDNGFRVSNYDTTRSEGRYSHCDEALSSFYRIYVFPWPIYAYKIVVRICFIDDESVLMRAVYLKHMY